MLTKVARLPNRIRTYAANRFAWRGIPSTAKDLALKIRADKLTYLSERKLASLIRSCTYLEDIGKRGLFIEAGCALGGSSILIAKLKRPERSLFVYDVFDIIPPPTENDTSEVHDRYAVISSGQSQGIDGDRYYGYIENLYNVVKDNFQSYSVDLVVNNISLIKGLLQDTMKIAEPVAFAHIDVDWYEPVKTCLDRIYPNLIEGGVIILDDFFDYGGCRKATNEFLDVYGDQFSIDVSTGSMKLTRIKTATMS